MIGRIIRDERVKLRKPMEAKVIGKFSMALLGLGAWMLASTPAKAQTYPSRPILVICPFTPGSAVDLVVRLIGPGMAEQLKTSIVVENRLGAAGMIGTTAVAKAPADGYTLLYSSPSHYINQSLYKSSMTYDPVKDFRPVARISNTPLIMVMAQSAPVNTLAELIAYVRAHPGKLNFSSAGSGGVTHLPAALLASMASLEIVHIPYKNGGEALTDTLRGEVLFTFVAVSTALPHIKKGTLKGIGVAGASRSLTLPDVPTIAESGLPGYQFSAWNGMFVRTGTPQDITTKLESALLRAAAAPEVTQKLLNAGLEAEPLNTRAFTERIQLDMPLWAKAVEAGNIKPE